MFIIFIFKGILIKANGHFFRDFFYESDIQIVGFLTVGYICLMGPEKHGANKLVKDG